MTCRWDTLMSASEKTLRGPFYSAPDPPVILMGSPDYPRTWQETSLFLCPKPGLPNSNSGEETEIISRSWFQTLSAMA